MEPFMGVFTGYWIYLFLIFKGNGAMSQPEVETSLGTIRGVSGDFYGTSFNIFRGIPYAKPPVGRLRFRPPVPVEPWQDTLNATEYGDICPQSESAIAASVALLSHTRMSEDCLTLDIYSPDNTDDELLTVMVFFYPGSFATGTTMLYDGSVLAASQNVVVVTVNYRLGALGFLSTMDKYANGNYGLLDQQLAIRWVKANIDGFGGDPDKITLFGRSAGGMSVGFQMLSPSNDGLFKRGIIQSNVPTSYYMAANPVMRARRLGSALNCTKTNNHRELVSCLRTKTWQEIVGNTPDLSSKHINLHPFLPVVDGEFVQDSPENLTDKLSNFTKFDLLLGFNSNEGKLYYYLMDIIKANFNASAAAGGLTSTEFQQVVSNYIHPYYEDKVGLLPTAVLNHYTVWKTPSSDRLRLVNLFRLIGDQFFVSPIVEVALKHTKPPKEDGKTYLYQFSHDGEMLHVESPYPDWLEGGAHGAEIGFVFGAPNSVAVSYLYTDEQRNLSSAVMKYWTNFAKTGNPNQGDPVDVIWPEYTTTQQQYLNLDLVVTVDNRVKAEDTVFWNDYIPSLSATSCPPLPTNCITVVGADLGLSLTLRQTSVLIQIFIGTVIALVVIVFVLCGALCGYHVKVNNIGREYHKINSLNQRLENVAKSLDDGRSDANNTGATSQAKHVTELE
ncbi:acetylcholinesterase-like [Glandiceps talaboti]